jgi:hypothetical protein
MQAAKKRKAAEQARLSSLFVAVAPAEPEWGSDHGHSKRQRAADGAVALDSGRSASASGFSFGFAITGT